MKQPYAKVPRFIELPPRGDNYYIMFTEDIIKANLNLIFPGYDVDSSYCIKISRDADILIDDTASSADLVAQLKKKVKKRKIGDVCRFVYDRAMPQDFLDFLVDAFRIHRDELVPGDKHLNLEDLRHLPNPNKSLRRIEKPQPMKLNILDEKESSPKRICCCITRTTPSSISPTSSTKQCTIRRRAKSWSPNTV